MVTEEKYIEWNGMKWAHPAQPPRASLLVASCKISTSTPSGGSSTYRTTDPLIKQFFTDNICGYLSCSTTLVFSNLMLRYWSTECRVPLMAKSFFNSTVTSFPTSSLKYEKNNMFARSAATQKKMRKAKYQAALLLPSTTYLQGHHLLLQLLHNLTKQRKINH